MRRLYTSQKTLNAWFVLLLVLVLSIAVLVLVLEANQYSNPACWSASYRKPPRSTIGNAADEAAIEYEYVSLGTSTTKSDAMCERTLWTVYDEETLHKSKNAGSSISI
jgi:hypothetical protein